MGFESLFGQKRLRHEAGESGDAQEWTGIDGVDLENNTVTLRRPRPAAPTAEPTGGEPGDDAPS